MSDAAQGLDKKLIVAVFSNLCCITAVNLDVIRPQ